MKKLLLVSLLLVFTLILYGQNSPNGQVSRNFHRGVFNYKGQMYYDVSTRSCAYITKDKYSNWRIDKKNNKIKFVNSPYAIYFYMENDTFKIYFHSDYNKRISKIFKECEELNKTFSSWDDMTFYITEQSLTWGDGGITYSGYRDTYLSPKDKIESTEFYHMYSIDIISTTYSSFAYIRIFKRFHPNSPLLLFKITKGDIFLDEKFYKINEKYIYHKAFVKIKNPLF